MYIKSIQALLQFTTVLPLGEPADFDAFAQRSYLYPIAGYVTGGIAAALILLVPVKAIGAALALAAALLISGCNHFDGLLDLGDGLMAHGSREKRIIALTDRQVGSGGVALAVMVTLLSFSGLLTVGSLPITILIAEVLAKTSMAILSATGTPFKEGLHSYLFSFSRPWFSLAALLLCLPLLILPLPFTQLLSGFLAMIIVVSLTIYAGKRLFGGVNGDLVGASNEITRMAVILALALVP